MSLLNQRAATSRVRILCFALIGLITALAVIVPAQADAKKKKKKTAAAKVSVMTRNVFLGADLGPALQAADIPSAIDGAGEIYNELELTNFPERAVPLAKEINKSKADLIGLQEVAHWRVQEPSDGGGPPISPIPTAELATETKYDFLKLLMDRVGKKYKVIAVQDEFEGELPADIDGDDSTGNGPLAAFGADLDARLTMRDVILLRKGGKVKAKKKTVEMAQFENAYEADVGGLPVRADRGWLSVEAKYKKNKKTKPTKFRFVNTHLEAFGDPTIREAQAKELFAPGGPLRSKKQVVLVGDLNSGVAKHNIGAGGGGSGDPDDTLAFEALLGFGMQDRGVDGGSEQTCCYPNMFDETFKFTHTVDHVMTTPKSKLLRSTVTGNDPAEITPSGLWPSDHGGLISKLKLQKPKKK